MAKPTLAAALAMSLVTGAAFAGTAHPASAALSPYTATRTGHKPRKARLEHCARKADFVNVRGQARAIYLRKCANG